MLKSMDVSKNPGSGQVTLKHLLLGVAFVQPIAGATAMLKHFGVGILRYSIAVPAALALGVVIVWLDWKIGKTVWLRCHQCPKQAQNAVALALFAVDLLWIVVGGLSGFKLAALVAKHVPQ
jgi:hypothetical protein